MTKKNEIYSDGLAQIHVVGTTVRMDFMTLEPQQDSQPVQNINNRVILPLQAFLSAYSTMQNLVNKLEQDGMIKKKEG